MEFEKSSAIESESRFGRDITMNVIFVRHGEKDKVEQGLSATGKSQATEFGKHMQNKDTIKAYTSPIQRAVETVESIVANAPHDKKMELRERVELQIPPFSEAMTNKFKEIVRNGEDPAEWYLEFADKRPDDETWSPVEVAEAFAYLVEKYYKMADRLYSGSNIDLLNGTHSVLPECLLKEVIVREIDGKKVVGFEKISDFGGTLKYVEPVEFLITIDHEGNKNIKLRFRDKEYGVDGERLLQLADVYRNKIKSE